MRLLSRIALLETFSDNPGPQLKVKYQKYENKTTKPLQRVEYIKNKKNSSNKGKIVFKKVGEYDKKMDQY